MPGCSITIRLVRKPGSSENVVTYVLKRGGIPRVPDDTDFVTLVHKKNYKE